MPWRPGDRLRHRFNPDLGPGLIRSIEGRTLVIEFPEADTSLRIAADTDALAPLDFPVGSRATLRSTGESVLVGRRTEGSRVRLADGREVDETELWPAPIGESPIERLAIGDVDSLEQLSLRLDALHLARRSRGGRPGVLPRRAHPPVPTPAATSPSARLPTDPVRWLLADEVGLGKTVEACLVLNHLLRTGRGDGTLVVAPDTLTVQWLGELWRKYHQVFVLLDDRRLLDVWKRSTAPGSTRSRPTDRSWSVWSSCANAGRLTEQAAEAGIDLLIVDEAHHLRRPRGIPATPRTGRSQPIAALGRHVLLLTATPLDDDAHGFFRLLQLVATGGVSGGRRPSTRGWTAAIRCRRAPAPHAAWTSAGCLPRIPAPARSEIEDPAGLERAGPAGARRCAPDPPPMRGSRRPNARRIRRALASGAALAALLDAADEESALRALARNEADRRRTLDFAWLAEQRRALEGAAGTRRWSSSPIARRWSGSVRRLSRRAQTRVGVFHEDLSPGQRDIEVAQFRLASGPSMLVSTECGGEGRNFEFCTRLVLFDLPWNPDGGRATHRAAGSHRTHSGRGDRVPAAAGTVSVPVSSSSSSRWDCSDRPLGGTRSRAGGRRTQTIEAARADGCGALPSRIARAFGEIVHQTRAALRSYPSKPPITRLHRDPYRPGEGRRRFSLACPKQLEQLTEPT